MGKDNNKLIAHFATTDIPYVSVDNLQDAVLAAYQHAHVGDTVLLSPCCASFDLFQNYEDRGRQFINAVRNL